MNKAARKLSKRRIISSIVCHTCSDNPDRFYQINIYFRFPTNKTFPRIQNFPNPIMIIIEKYSSEQGLQLNAWGDCCSESWLEPKDIPFDVLIGNRIEKIDYEKYGTTVDLPESGVQNYDRNYPVSISLAGGKTFEFYLRNSSNGFYNGWMEITALPMKKS